MTKNRFQFAAGRLPVLLVAVLAAVLAAGCGQDETGRPASVQNPPVPESFTFFDLGPSTAYTAAVRKRLSENLGSDAIERRGTVDLTINPPGLLADRFPNLQRLHQDLNSAVNARVEHDITRLTYRYPEQKNTPFQRVRLVFSNLSSRPLYFQIVLKKEGSAIVETLREKYGPPEETVYGGMKTPVLAWEKNRDMLIVSTLHNRLGAVEYHVMFCFVNNLDQLLAAENMASRQQEKRLKQAGKTAF